MSKTSRPRFAVLLAAGRGKRLRPYTDATPKPLLPFNGRPMLDHVLAAAANAGIRHVCLVTHHLSEQIEQFVGDGSKWGLTAVFCKQKELRGTAHALQTAVRAHPTPFQENASFLLAATDYILPNTYLSDLVHAHTHNGSAITVSLKKMSLEEVTGRSSVVFSADGGIDQIVEKPAPGQVPSEFVASLITILPAAITRYLSNMTPSPRGEYEVQTIMNQMMADGYQAQGIVQKTPQEWEPQF
ncbi:MAG: NTP transferase domain-containing protein [Chloroflexi bacterium]|nr:NTP transferase domain-containing protein [Chloroflexota bacterium]